MYANHSYNKLRPITPLLTHLGTMLSKGAPKFLPLVVVDCPSQVRRQNFARGTLSKATTVIDTHVSAIFGTCVRLNNALVYHLSPNGIEVALAQRFQFGFVHIAFVYLEQFVKAMILNISANVDKYVFVMLSSDIMQKKRLTNPANSDCAGNEAKCTLPRMQQQIACARVIFYMGTILDVFDCCEPRVEQDFLFLLP